MVFLLNRPKFLCTRKSVVKSKFFIIICKLVERVSIHSPFDFEENYLSIDVSVYLKVNYRVIIACQHILAFRCHDIKPTNNAVFSLYIGTLTSFCSYHKF